MSQSNTPHVKPCDFDGRNVTFRHAWSNTTATLKFRSFDSATHPERKDLSIPGEMFWDIATKTLYYKDRDGDIWRCMFENATMQATRRSMECLVRVWWDCPKCGAKPPTVHDLGGGTHFDGIRTCGHGCGTWETVEEWKAIRDANVNVEASAVKQPTDEGLDETACSRSFADCDCDEQIPDDESYVCEKCERDVTICSECYTIIKECGCGHCKEGATFRESD